MDCCATLWAKTCVLHPLYAAHYSPDNTACDSCSSSLVVVLSPGALLPQRLADLVAYHADPVTCPVDELLQLQPAVTMVGGRAVYDPDGVLRT